ncbi:MAG: cytochrome-c peroxidase [Myxococcota bacterium]|nr:cytochrome-c peroxidase [Myxococcales bacterium]
MHRSLASVAPSFASLAAAALFAACGAQEPASSAASQPAAAPSAPAPAPAPEPAAPSPAEALAKRANAVFGVLPAVAESANNVDSDARVELGRALYYDKRLSKNHDVACNSCHQLDRFGVDGEPTSPGHQGQRGDRNSPTSLNAALHIAQFWDGRAADVEAQAKGPVLNPVEMAMPSAEAVESTLRSIPGYAPMFEAAFPEEDQPVTFDNMALAIAAFERRLVTPGAFDAFLRGDAGALDAQQQRGLATFMDTGCITCHNGPTIGGKSFQKLGLVHPYETADLGREKLTGNASDRHVFKVPGLRNIAETGPYFHDGSIATLDEAIRLMAHHQLGKELDDAQVADIAAFLRALTGDVDADLVAMPELPESGPSTPAPDPS